MNAGEPGRNLLKAERVDFILRRLGELYPTQPIPLDHKDPYTLTPEGMYPLRLRRVTLSRARHVRTSTATP